MSRTEERIPARYSAQFVDDARFFLLEEVLGKALLRDLRRDPAASVGAWQWRGEGVARWVRTALALPNGRFLLGGGGTSIGTGEI